MYLSEANLANPERNPLLEGLTLRNPSYLCWGFVNSVTFCYHLAKRMAKKMFSPSNFLTNRNIMKVPHNPLTPWLTKTSRSCTVSHVAAFVTVGIPQVYVPLLRMATKPYSFLRSIHIYKNRNTYHKRTVVKTIRPWPRNRWYCCKYSSECGEVKRHKTHLPF